MREINIIIDGYNLIRCTPTLLSNEARSLEAGREALLDRLFLYKGGKPADITVVFDGPDRRSYFARGGIRVQFAPSADDTVVALAGPGKTVVSSDLEVQSAASRCGARVVGSLDFWGDIKGTIEKRRYRKGARPPRLASMGTWDKADWDEDDYYDRPKKRKGRKKRR